MFFFYFGPYQAPVTYIYIYLRRVYIKNNYLLTYPRDTPPTMYIFKKLKVQPKIYLPFQTSSSFKHNQDAINTGEPQPLAEPHTTGQQQPLLQIYTTNSNTTNIYYYVIIYQTTDQNYTDKI